MRHFVLRGAYHIATAASQDSSADYSSMLTELPEGDDGKCDWCRAADERWEKVLAERGEDTE